MKSSILTLSLSLLAALSFASAQQPAARKPPVGVPADAQPFNGKWYRVYNERMPWQRARQRCSALAGQLAVVPDQPTWEFLRKLAQGTSLWLGATDEQTEGIWQWVDGTPFEFKAWMRGAPDNYRGRENYLHTFHDEWNDAPKDGEHAPRQFVIGFICEWKTK